MGQGHPAAPRVSVILAVHSGVNGKRLRLAIDSILEQTLRSLELIVVQDGPIDVDAELVINEVCRKDSRVQVLRHASNRGLGVSLNTALPRARGEFVARMDADDWSHPERLQRQVGYLEQNPDVSFAGTFAREVHLDSGDLFFEKRMPTEHAAIFRFLVARSPFVHPTVMFRRGFFERVGYYSEVPGDRAPEDLELWARALLRGEVAGNLDVFLYDFFIDRDFWTRRRNVRWAINELLIKWNYALRARLALHWLAVPPLVFTLRLAPAGFKRFAYRHLRHPRRPLR